MQVELECPRCRCRDHAELDNSFGQALEHISAEGPWYALGDGETWEDRIHSYLTTAEQARCPRCGAACEVSEASLAQLSRELLAQW